MKTNKLEIKFPVFQGDILHFSESKKIKNGIQFINKYFKVIEIIGKRIKAIELNFHNYDPEGLGQEMGLFHKIPDYNSHKNSKTHNFKLSIEFKTKQWKTICFKNELGKTYLYDGDFFNNGHIESHKGKYRKLKFLTENKKAS